MKFGNVGVYYRVSTDMQELDSQKLAVERWLEENKKEISAVRVFQDLSASGSKTDRPGYQDLLTAIRLGELSTVAVYKLDRFSRDANTAIQQILGMDRNNVGFISISQPMLNFTEEMPFRRMILACFAELAQLEREQIVQRVKAGLEAAKARGVRLGRPLKVTAAVQKKARSMREQGMSYAAISKVLGISVGAVHKTVNGVTL